MTALSQGDYPATRTPKTWYLVAFLGAIISLYALVVLVARVYPPPLEDSFLARPWGIYSHVFFAMFGLAIGPWQFRGPGPQQRNPRHRQLGAIYMISAFGTGLSGFYMAFFVYGGGLNRLGFASLAVALFAVTAIGLQRILNRDFVSHREWMVRSYALMFAAVTLRLWLPVLITVYGGDFDPAYAWMGWLCWVPNLLWAEWHLRRTKRHEG